MTSEREQPAGFRDLFRAPGFRRLLIGQAVSSLGDWVATLAFIVAAYDLTGNQAAVAGVLILRLVPPMLAAPLGGALADRLPRRTIMVFCDLARAGLIALVPFVGIGLLYVIALLHESVSLFFLPARDASIPSLAPEGTLTQANGLILATSFASLPISAALFGGLRLVAQNIPSAIPFATLFRDHPTSFAFFFDAATFVFSASMIAGLPLMERRSSQGGHLFTGMIEGFRYGFRHPGLRSLAYALIVSMFGGGVLFAVGIAYIRETLGGSDVDFGWLAALWGLGMGLGVGIARGLVRRGEGVVFLASVALCGSILIVMGLLPILWLSFVMAVTFGAAFSVAIILALTMAQVFAEDRIRGRIMGSVQLLFRVGLGAGAIGIGALAHSISELRIGWGRVAFTVDGNQLGLVAGGLLILMGAAAASTGIRSSRREVADRAT